MNIDIKHRKHKIRDNSCNLYQCTYCNNNGVFKMFFNLTMKRSYMMKSTNQEEASIDDQPLDELVNPR